MVFLGFSGVEATFREVSNKITELSIKLGARTKHLEEAFKGLEELQERPTGAFRMGFASISSIFEPETA